MPLGVAQHVTWQPLSRESAPFNGTLELTNSSATQLCSGANDSLGPILNLSTGAGGIHLTAESKPCAQIRAPRLNRTAGSFGIENGSIGAWLPVAYAPGAPSFFVNLTYAGNFRATWVPGSCVEEPKLHGIPDYQCVVSASLSLYAYSFLEDNSTGKVLSYGGNSAGFSGDSVGNLTDCPSPGPGPACSNYSWGSWGKSLLHGHVSIVTKTSANSMQSGHRYFLFFALVFSVEASWWEFGAKLTGGSVGATVSFPVANPGLRLDRVTET